MVPKPDKYARLEDALGGVAEMIRPVTGTVSLRTKLAFGRVVAVDLTSPRDVPEFATSHMDGYAAIAENLQDATGDRPGVLRVIGAGRLGASTVPPIRKGEAVRVATGGRMPPGADTILPVESVEEKEGRLLVRYQPTPGSYLYGAGEDVRKGETILSKGQAIRAQDVGLLLTLGIPKIKVRRDLAVSVIATGSELTNSASPGKGKVRNSHSAVFLRLCEAQGWDAVDLGIVGDDRKEISKALDRSLSHSDFTITLGGTSVGRHDFVGDAVAALHPTVVFHGIGIDRGRVAGVAVIRGKPVLMAPGPIQGAMNAFLLLGLPIMGILSGRRTKEFAVPCKMGEDWEARKRFAHFRKVVYVRLLHDGEWIASPLRGETESMSVLTRADGYIEVPEGVTTIAKGDSVTARQVPGFSWA